MKRIGCIFLCLTIVGCLLGCRQDKPETQIVATTQPVYDFTTAICEGTGITVSKLITESVSCLHDYTLQVSQMRAIEGAEVVVLSGAGMEDFLEDSLLAAKKTVDCSQGITLICPDKDAHHHEDHHHDTDSHIWLSPANASIMAENIYKSLSSIYPANKEIFKRNFSALQESLAELSAYGKEKLGVLSCRDIITFHDGFSYMAQAFDLHIIHAIEEESGSEASAAELISLTKMVAEHNLPAIFTECNGSTSAAEIISAETGARIYDLDMCMSHRNYFDAMKHNIDTLKEALE